jgi:hypothetical protein
MPYYVGVAVFPIRHTPCYAKTLSKLAALVINLCGSGPIFLHEKPLPRQMVPAPIRCLRALVESDLPDVPNEGEGSCVFMMRPIDCQPF